MADSQVFDWVCERLERVSALNRLEARGTVRLALRTAGLEPKAVTGEQLAVVLEKVLPDELAARSIPDGDTICKTLATEARGLSPETSSGSESPEDVFRRLGG